MDLRPAGSGLDSQDNTGQFREHGIGSILADFSMGIYDRAYSRDDRADALSVRPRSAVATLLVITTSAWVAQLLFRDSDPSWGGAITRFLAATPQDIFEGFPRVWKIFTANFAHDWKGPWHLFANMLFLFFFGRELEIMLGRREFYLLYFVSGSIAILAEVVVQRLAGYQTTLVLGASGAVTAIVVLSTLIEPKRQILILGFIPAPVWALCAFFLVQDVLGATSASTRGSVAHFAHLAGAIYGLLYWRFDLRYEIWSRVFGRLFPRSTRGTHAAPRPGNSTSPERHMELRTTPSPDPVSSRIDELLAKIYTSGLDSLTAEEREFLDENSSKYHRP